MYDRQILVQLLKSELTYLEQGGYRRQPRYPWRPNFIFEDSPTCINFRVPESERKPCAACPWVEFVPLDRRSGRIPCRQIGLTEAGDTVNSFYEYGTDEELEAALRNWLKLKIADLTAEDNIPVRTA